MRSHDKCFYVLGFPPPCAASVTSSKKTEIALKKYLYVGVSRRNFDGVYSQRLPSLRMFWIGRSLKITIYRSETVFFSAIPENLLEAVYKVVCCCMWCYKSTT